MILCYRSGAENKIRQYLVKNNYIDTIIQLPANLFFGVSIATCIIVLKKSAKKDNSILFLDASNLFKKEGNKNRMMPEHQDAVVNAVEERKDVQYFTKLVSCDDVAKNDYNLSVSSYVEKEVIKEDIDIDKVNADINDLMAKAVTLNDEINKIIAEL